MKTIRHRYEIRPSRADDYLAVARLFAGPRVIWGTLQVPYTSPELWRKRLAEPLDGLHSLVACYRTQVVGVLGLHTLPHQPRRRHVGEIGMAVRDDWQNRGVGTALMREVIRLADEWLNLDRLELYVYPDNIAAARLYRRFGFEVEGTLRHYAYRDGRYVDAWIMGRLRPAEPRPAS